MTPHEINRRTFLQRSGLVSAGLLSGAPFAAASQGGEAKGVVLVHDPDDKVVAANPARWAFDFLNSELNHLSVCAPRAENARMTILAGGSSARLCRELLGQAKLTMPVVPESFVLLRGEHKG